MPQKDNTTLSRKVSLRRSVLARIIGQPVVLETHGGMGHVFRECYSEIESGVVMENNPAKTEILVRQRPTWAVYEGDCEAMTADGVGRRPFNLVDMDPYGSPWPIVDAYFTSERERPDVWWLVVNDGLRNKIKIGGAGSVNSFEDVAREFGSSAYARYLDVCQWLLTKKASEAPDGGWDIARFWGYYCGRNGDMTHYAAMFTRAGAARTQTGGV